MDAIGYAFGIVGIILVVLMAPGFVQFALVLLRGVLPLFIFGISVSFATSIGGLLGGIVILMGVFFAFCAFLVLPNVDDIDRMFR